MKKRALTVIILTALFTFLFSTVSFANSSWHWVTASPLKVLPFAILFTLIIETLAIALFGKVAETKKAFIIVCLANLFSFLAPYIFRAYRFIPTSGGFKILSAFDKGPYYIILTGYLALTLIVELPIVYLLLKKYAKAPMGLAISILSSNIITTLLVAICERLICVGRW